MPTSDENLGACAICCIGIIILSLIVSYGGQAASFVSSWLTDVANFVSIWLAENYNEIIDIYKISLIFFGVLLSGSIIDSKIILPKIKIFFNDFMLALEPTNYIREENSESNESCIRTKLKEFEIEPDKESFSYFLIHVNNFFQLWYAYHKVSCFDHPWINNKGKGIFNTNLIPKDNSSPPNNLFFNNKKPEEKYLRWGFIQMIAEENGVASIDFLISVLKDKGEDIRIKKDAERAIKKIIDHVKDKKDKKGLFCNKCFHKYQKYSIPLSLFNREVYQACRKCQDTGTNLENIERVTAVIDYKKNLATKEQNQKKSEVLYWRENNNLIINWYSFGFKPFDYDECRIESVDDVFDFDLICLNIEADPDWRHIERYGSIPVMVSKDLELPRARTNLIEKYLGPIQLIN